MNFVSFIPVVTRLYLISCLSVFVTVKYRKTMGVTAPTAPLLTMSLKEKDRLNLSHKSNQYVTTSIKTIINTFKENRERLRDFVVHKKLRYYLAGRAHPSFS